MPNIRLVIGNQFGSTDISAYVRVNTDEGLDMGQGDMLEPAFSDSPLFEGQTLVSMHAKNKEIKIPLYLHPQVAPYSNDALNQLVQEINATLRPIVDLGQPGILSWTNAQAVFPTYFTIQFGRFEPSYKFRVTEKGWLAGELHLWVTPYAHTATERVMGTWPAPAAQSGGVFTLSPGFFSRVLNDNPNVYLRLGDPMGPTALDSGPNGISSCVYSPTGVQYNQPGGNWGDPNHSVLLNNAGATAGGLTLPGGPLTMPTQFTWMCWANLQGATNLGMLFSDYITNASLGLTGAYLRFLASGNLQAGLNSGGTVAPPGIQWNGFVPIGTWSLIALSYDGATARLWQNGQIRGAVGMATPYIPGTSSYLYVGNWNTEPFDGYLDEVVIFGYAVSSGAMASYWAAGPLGFVGDVPPQFDIRTQVGSYLADDGRITVMSALPYSNYAPIIPVGSFVGLSPSAIIFAASGAWASQFLAIDSMGGVFSAIGGATGNTGYFSVALSPASVYAGDNRLLGLVRARYQPFGLRAFDVAGNPLGPTVVASALNGWQLVDYGNLRLPPWLATAVINIQAYAGIPYSASGQFAPVRAAPAWTKEHGPIFVIPNQQSIINMDFNSPPFSFDGFDGASGFQPQNDALGNPINVPALGSLSFNGNSQLVGPSVSLGITQSYLVTSSQIAVSHDDIEAEAVFTLSSAPSAGGNNSLELGLFTASPLGFPYLNAALLAYPGPTMTFLLSAPNANATQVLTWEAGQYHMKLMRRGSLARAELAGPSGSFPGAASGAGLSLSISIPIPTYGLLAGFAVNTSNPQGIAMEAWRSRYLASQGYQARDYHHLYQPLAFNSRMNPSAVDTVDLQQRQRGPVQALTLSPQNFLGNTMFVMSMPFDQGPANDLLNVDIRVRERFTYAR